VLEIGCGNGDKLMAFQAAGYEVYGFESGAADFEICQSNNLKVFNRPFDIPTAVAHAPYSVVLLSNILEHVPDPGKLLQDIYPLVEPQGILLIDVPNAFNSFHETFLAKTNERRWFLCPSAHLYYFTRDPLSNLLEDQGWTIHHRTTRFPMELFLLMGRNYVSTPKLGRSVHIERVEIAKAFLGGNEETLWKFYDALAQANLGREIIVICQKAEPS
jgi:SAM-dependent methyltransferase